MRFTMTLNNTWPKQQERAAHLSPPCRTLHRETFYERTTMSSKHSIARCPPQSVCRDPRSGAFCKHRKPGQILFRHGRGAPRRRSRHAEAGSLKGLGGRLPDGFLRLRPSVLVEAFSSLLNLECDEGTRASFSGIVGTANATTRFPCLK